jgi:hypothetical protein
MTAKYQSRMPLRSLSKKMAFSNAKGKMLLMTGKSRTHSVAIQISGLHCMELLSRGNMEE